MEKGGQGSCDYSSDELVYVAKKNDNSIVNVCSNYSTHPPRHESKRRVPQPQLISTYSKGMGCVDLLDFLSASYKPSISGKSGISHYLLMY